MADELRHLAVVAMVASGCNSNVSTARVDEQFCCDSMRIQCLHADAHAIYSGPARSTMINGRFSIDAISYYFEELTGWPMDVLQGGECMVTIEGWEPVPVQAQLQVLTRTLEVSGFTVTHEESKTIVGLESTDSVEVVTRAFTVPTGQPLCKVVEDKLQDVNPTDEVSVYWPDRVVIITRRLVDRRCTQ